LIFIILLQGKYMKSISFPMISQPRILSREQICGFARITGQAHSMLLRYYVGRG